MSNVSMNMGFTWAVKGIIHPKIESPIQIQDKSFFSQQYYKMTLEDLDYGAQVMWTELLVFLELF